MQAPRKRRRRRSRNKSRKARVTFKQHAVVRKKSDSTNADTLQRIEGRPPADNGVTFKVKVRRK